MTITSSRPASPTPSSLVRYLEAFNPLLRRSESRAALAAYVSGLASPASPKTATEIARVVPGTSSQRLQEFLTRTSWDEREMNRRRLSQLAREASSGPSVQVIEEIVIAKSGTHSVGTARQCRGPRGGVHNCQRLIVAHYADDAFDWPIGAALYLPHEWCDDPERRSAARIPADVGYREPATLAASLLQEGAAAGVRADIVIAGSAIGEDARVLDMLDAMGVPYLAAIAGLEGLDLPASPAQHARGNGAGGTRGRLVAVAAALPASSWTRVACRDGGGTPRVREYALLPARRAGWSDADGGQLLLERHVRGDRALHAYLGSRLGSRDVGQIARLSQRCGSASAYYEGTARRLGFEDYEGRLWVGFHRHLLLVHLATSWMLLSDAYL